MALEKYSAEKAFEVYKGNEFSNWPERNSMKDRFAEKASPQFKTGTQLRPGEKVFTIGSCFARNVERELSALGFEIPTQSFTVDEKYWGGQATTLLNNYVVGAVIPQINWAFGNGEAFSIEKNCVSVGKKFKDLLVAGNTRPMEKDDVLDQRERINEIYRELSDTRVVILTLGLIEAWWDTKAEIYINSTPPKQAIRNDPDRFELHVLEYEEVLQDLQRLAAMLKDHCLDDFHLIVTVSPVPLTSTFRDIDIAIANSYSKSILRAAAEKLVVENDFVSYFPSFESFMLTNKSTAFVGDQVHPHPELVAHNISRLVQAYTGQDQHDAASYISQSIALANQSKKNEAIDVLQDAMKQFPENGKIRTQLARLYVDMKMPDAAKEVLADPSTDDIAEGSVLQAQMAIKDRDFETALGHAQHATRLWPNYKAGLFNLARSLIELDRLEEAQEAIDKLSSHSQISIWRSNVFYLRGLSLEKQGLRKEATELYMRGASFHRTRHIRASLERVNGSKGNAKGVLARLFRR